MKGPTLLLAAALSAQTALGQSVLLQIRQLAVGGGELLLDLKPQPFDLLLLALDVGVDELDL